MVDQWWVVHTQTTDGISQEEMTDILMTEFVEDNVEIAEMPEADQEHFNKLTKLRDFLQVKEGPPPDH